MPDDEAVSSYQNHSEWSKFKIEIKDEEGNVISTQSCITAITTNDFILKDGEQITTLSIPSYYSYWYQYIWSAEAPKDAEGQSLFTCASEGAEVYYKGRAVKVDYDGFTEPLVGGMYVQGTPGLII